MKQILIPLFSVVLFAVHAAELPAVTSNWQWHLDKPAFSLEEKNENGVPVFKVFGPVTITSREFIPAAENDKFRISYELKTTGFPSELIIECFDKNKKQINPINVLAIDNSENVLAAPVKKGDKVIRVKNSGIWQTPAGFAVAFDAKENFSDLPNFNTIPIKAVRNLGQNLLIQLSSPCSEAYPAGTQLRLHRTKTTAGNNKFNPQPIWFKNQINTVSGTVIDSNTAIYPGTAFIRIMIKINDRSSSKGHISHIKNIRWEKFGFNLKLLAHSVVADKYPEYRMSPSTLIRRHNGELIAVYMNRGDIDAGCASYFAISKDNGKTWAQGVPHFLHPSPQWGQSTILYRQPDGKMIAAVTAVYHKRVPKNFFTDTAENRLREYTKLDLYISNDDGKTFEFLQNVGNTRYRVITGSGNSLLELPNGDWLLPVWAYDPLDDPDAVSGSGFIRSTDKGKTWGKVEAAFKNDPTKLFNENVFTITPDGKLAAFARFDMGPREQQFLHRTESSDCGKTWSEPVPTAIVGIWPSMIKLKNGIYVLFCGVKTTQFNTHEPHVFLSRDAENFQDMGPVYYSRPFHLNGKQDGKYWGTGSSQCVTAESDNSFYVVFEGADIAVKSGSHPFGLRYIDFNHFQADFAE